jgi:outer membrane biosynthesis protein TonB
MRRSTVLILAAAALALAACEIRTDYAMVIDDDTSATLAFAITYDAEAAEMFGPAESFLEQEVEGDLGPDIEGVTLLSAEADSSDPENQRVTATFAARDAEAFDRLVADLFPSSSFTTDGGSTWVLALRPDADIAEDFGDESALDELGLDFLSGEVRVDHAGSQVAMTGGTSEGGNQVVWNPYGADSLEVVMDLSGAAPPDPAPGDDGSADEPGDELPEEPGDEVTEELPEEPVEEPAEELSEESGAEELDEVAGTVEEDDGGLSLLLLALVGGGLLLLALLVVLMLRGRGKGADDAGQGTGQPAAVAATAGSYQPSPPPGGADPSQQPTQQLHPTPPPRAADPSQLPTQQLHPTPPPRTADPSQQPTQQLHPPPPPPPPGS